MPNIQHKRGTRAALNDLAAANGLLPGQIYVISDEARLACALTVSTYETYAKSSEAGGGSPWVAFDITVTSFKGAYETYVNIPAVGVSPGDVVQLMFAPVTDDDENAPDFLLLRSMSAVAETNAFKLSLAFDEPASGLIKLQYKV